MTIKPVSFGSAVYLFFAAGAADAADLPMAKAGAVEYVKVCTQFGSGFFYIPGSDTCLKISGDIRANYFHVLNTFPTRAADVVNFGGRAQIAFDARTSTDYGVLRSFFAIDGNFGGGSATSFVVDKAYIQLGGLTAGFAHSFYGIYDNDFGNDIFQPYFAGPTSRALLAYTAAFGAGVTATVSAEDGKAGRSAAVWNDTANAFGTDIVGNVVGAYAGLTAPDGVARLRYDSEHVLAAVSAAVHQVRVLPGAGLPAVDTKYGYAFGASLAFAFPFLQGAHFVVEGNYAKGANDYIYAWSTPSLGGFGPAEAAVVPATGVVKLSSGWSVVSEFGANVTSAITVNIIGSYLDFKVPDADGLGYGTVFDDSFRRYTVGGNVFYSLTRGFKIGAEVYYDHTKYDAPTDPAAPGIKLSYDGWGGGVSIRREF